MKLIDLTCPGCGAVIKVNSELSRGLCNFCGKEFIVDDEIQKIEVANGKKLGYEQEQGRQEAVEEKREELLKKISASMDSIKQLNRAREVYLSEKQRCTKQIVTIDKSVKIAGAITGTITGACAAGIILFCGSIMNNDTRLLSLFFFLLFFGIGYLLTWYNSSVHGIGRTITVKEEPSQECIRLEQQYKNKEKEVADKIEFIPVDYRTTDAVENFYKYILNRRADDLRQAMNLYEEELHRRRLESTQQAILKENETQTKIQRSSQYK